MSFEKRFRYRFGDLDRAGIAYYPSFFHYFHQCFEDWWSDGLGKDYAKVMDEDHLGLPAVHIETDFFEQIRYGDEPMIHLGILRMGKSSVDFAFWMTKEGLDGAVCSAKITTVAVDMRDMTKRELPEVWRARFEPFVISAEQVPGRAKRG